MSNQTDAKQRLALQLSKKKVFAPENHYWGMKDGQIWDNIKNKPFTIKPFQPLINVVAAYFKSMYEVAHSEAQVLIIDDEQIKQIDVSWIPQIPSPIKHLHILVLPQDNSYGGTTISEAWWQTNVASKHVTPLMRIHSHHTLEAYQSPTDWSTLNSNTLEMVIGKVTSNPIAISYWLDILGTNNKETVFYTNDNGKSVHQGQNGRPKTPLNK